MQRIRYLVAVCVAILSARFSSVGLAGDAGFLPGDSFFQCWVTLDSIGEMLNDRELILRESNSGVMVGAMMPNVGAQEICLQGDVNPPSVNDSSPER
jgi:hypothetical protein